MNPPDSAAATIRDTAAQRLGQRLRRARLARNLTQGEVAKNQFSVSYVSAVERGQIRPSLGALEKLAERLHVPLTDLLNDAHPDQAFSALPSERRESGADRWREEVESRLYEAQHKIADGRPDAVRDAIDVLARLGNRQLTPRESALVQLFLSQAYAQQGRADEARDEAQKGLAVAERAGDPVLAERIRFELASAYSSLHSHSLALDSYRKNLQALEDGVVRDPIFRVHVLSRIGSESYQLGMQDEALKYLSQAAESAKQATDPRVLGEAYSALSQSYSAKGDHSTARYYIARSIAAFEEARNRREVAAVHAEYGRALAENGQTEQALAELTTARDTAVAQQDAGGIAAAQRALAELYLLQDRLDDATQAAEEALRRADAVGDTVQRAESLMTLAKVQEHKNQVREAEKNFGDAIQLLTEVHASAALSTAYETFSGFLERQGQERRALDMLKQAHNISARPGAHTEMGAGIGHLV